jgi:glycosyltransferase involved in cell wall biosynthesis
MSEPTHYPPFRRIVHVVDSLEVGGLERVVTDLATAQKASGHQVSVFSICSTAGFKAELIDKGIDVIEGHKAGALDRKVILGLRHWIKKQSADIVHAHNFVPNYYAAAAMIALHPAPRLVCTCHDMGMRLSNKRLRTLFKLSLLRTAHVAMVGTQVHQRFVGSGLVSKAHATTVLNGIPVERFQPSQARRQAARMALKLPENTLAIGCVGRLVPLKNHARMIAIMPDLLSQNPALRLVIIGDGELSEALRQQTHELGLDEHVILTGARKDVADLLPALDIFALPSQTEGLSIALLEACASGLAVVASKVGGNPEIIHEGETGLLIPADDNIALTRALSSLLTNSNLRQRLGQNAHNWVSERASISALRQAYDKVYLKALAK